MCYSLSTKKDGDQFPCGRCEECRKSKLNGWLFRIMQEERICESANWLTLTYDNDNVPITDRGGLTVSVDDVQKFMKRLRKAHCHEIEYTKWRTLDGVFIGKKRKTYYPYTNLKYFLCAEYGEESMRPHYHLILFNAEIDKIQDAWQKGSVYFGKVESASVAYSLKYMLKPGKVKKDDYLGRKKEFRLISKGMGINYVERMKKYHKGDLENRFHLTIEDGKKIGMPRYYKEKIYELDELVKAGEISAMQYRWRLCRVIEGLVNKGDYHHKWRNRQEAKKFTAIQQTKKSKNGKL